LQGTTKRRAPLRYRERQRAAQRANRLDGPTPRRHSIPVAAAQRLQRGVQLLIAGDGSIVDRTGIQAARTEWLGAWDQACRWGFRAARCRSRYLPPAVRLIVLMFMASIKISSNKIGRKRE